MLTTRASRQPWNRNHFIEQFTRPVPDATEHHNRMEALHDPGDQALWESYTTMAITYDHLEAGEVLGEVKCHGSPGARNPGR